MNISWKITAAIKGTAFLFLLALSQANGEPAIPAPPTSPPPKDAPATPVATPAGTAPANEVPAAPVLSLIHI